MLNKIEISDFIIQQLNTICKDNPQEFTNNTQLVGEQRSIKSVELVELLLALEEYVEDNTLQDKVTKYASLRTKVLDSIDKKELDESEYDLLDHIVGES